MPTIPGLGIGLFDLARAGADAFNAKSLGELEAERLQREEEERQAKRREDALRAAVLQLDQEGRSLRLKRDREELDRIRRGLTPVPERKLNRPQAPVVGLGTRDFDEFKDRFNQVTEMEEDRSSRVTRARESVQEEFRANRPDAPPRDTEIRRVSEDIVRATLSGNPTMPPEQLAEMVLSEAGLASLTPAIRLLVEGGQVNNTTLLAAYQRIRGSDLETNAEFQGLKTDIDALCQAGVSANEIASDVEQNPNYARFREPLDSYIFSLNCGQ